MPRSCVKASYSNDGELVAAMLSGDEQAFRTFFDMYFPRLYRFAFSRLGGDAEAAREVVQSALIKAVRNLAGYRREAAMFSWLCQICRRQIIDLARSHERQARHLVAFDDGEATGDVLESIEAPHADQPQRAYDAAQTRHLIRSVLDTLPSPYGDVLEWKYIDGRSVEEIGQLLGTGRVAAQSTLARARIAFRESLQTVLGAEAAELLTELRGTPI